MSLSFSFSFIVNRRGWNGLERQKKHHLMSLKLGYFKASGSSFHHNKASGHWLRLLLKVVAE